MSSVRSIIIGSLICAAAALNYDEAKDIILENVKSYKPSIGKSLCQANTCCNITSTEACSISSFEKGETTMVLPGGKTRCIYSYSTPFAFQVGVFLSVFSLIINVPYFRLFLETLTRCCFTCRVVELAGMSYLQLLASAPLTLLPSHRSAFSIAPMPTTISRATLWCT